MQVAVKGLEGKPNLTLKRDQMSNPNPKKHLMHVISQKLSSHPIPSKPLIQEIQGIKSINDPI